MRFPEASATRQATPPSSPSLVWSRSPQNAATARTHHSRTCRVLIVDDEPDVLRSLASTLAHDGFEVTAVGSLASGIAALEKYTFDLVLTDLYLGNSDLGSQVAQAAQTIKPAPPVIILTGKPTFDGAQAALRSHVADMVVKPVDPQKLLSTCNRVMQEAALERRNRELESVNQVLTSVLPRTIEIKDPTTSGHAARVVEYTDTLAERCGVSLEDRASLRLASLLHDVGKIGIPDHILTKPGPLTADEREIINRHPKMGYEVLAGLTGHENVRNWVYQHHERWDGKGYPNKMARDEVALPGRILVLAEVYDALAEVRSYKPAWPIPKIVTFFRAEAGKQFDPDLAHLVANGLEKSGPRFFSAQKDMLFA
ncbi:MAG: response regulator RpfG family c-di-GMP phosphodiesterase [Planctomycetota bacterium]|jgi:response regulator RpfG family c-di-GMP phosphodiesterase